MKTAVKDEGYESYESMDSLDFLDLIAKLEEVLGVTIPDDTLAGIKTEDDLIGALDGLRASV